MQIETQFYDSSLDSQTASQAWFEATVANQAGTNLDWYPVTVKSDGLIHYLRSRPFKNAGVVLKQGDVLRVRFKSQSSTEVVVEIEQGSGSIGSNTQSQGGKSMNGKVYDAVVVRTKNVPAAPGASNVVQVSEVVHTKTGYIGLNDETAKAEALAEAIGKVKDLKTADPLEPVEVKLRAWA